MIGFRLGGGADHHLRLCSCFGGKEPPDPPGLSKRAAAKAALAAVPIHEQAGRAMTRRSAAGLYIRPKSGGKWNGYLVQVPKPGGGLPLSKLFTVGRYGGKRAALAVAMRWRDRTYKRLWGESISPRGRWIRRTPRRRNGIVGVFSTKYIKKTTVDGRRYQYLVHLIVAQVGPAKGRFRKTFSVRRHGLARAKSMAEAARKKMVQQYLQ